MRKYPLVIFAVIVCTLLVLGGIYWYRHPTHFTYDDVFVLGSTEEEIVDRYGPFFQRFTNGGNELRKAEYMIRDDTPELVMGYDNSLWYEIWFENGIAVNVDLREGYIGG